MAGGINHIENSTFGFQGSILDPTVATIQQNNPSIDQMTKNSSYRICPSDQLAFGGFSDLLPDTSPGLQNKISDHLVPHDSVPVPRPHQFQPDFHLHQLSICKRGAELVDYFPGTQTAFPDIRGEIINKGKRGPKPRNTNCPRSNDVYEKLFKERKVFRAFIEERDCRLISFFCCFRSVFCEKNQVRFEKAISRLLGCRWAKKLLAYIFLLQPRSVKKKRAVPKKDF
jgi:hypothetical protein